MLLDPYQWLLVVRYRQQFLGRDEDALPEQAKHYFHYSEQLCSKSGFDQLRWLLRFSFEVVACLGQSGENWNRWPPCYLMYLLFIKDQ